MLLGVGGEEDWTTKTKKGCGCEVRKMVGDRRWGAGGV
jgi:hypothetical protein